MSVMSESRAQARNNNSDKRILKPENLRIGMTAALGFGVGVTLVTYLAVYAR